MKQQTFYAVCHMGICLDDMSDHSCKLCTTRQDAIDAMADLFADTLDANNISIDDYEQAAEIDYATNVDDVDDAEVDGKHIWWSQDRFTVRDENNNYQADAWIAEVVSGGDSVINPF